MLLGRSGSGKTTALKMVNGLLFPSAGEVLVDGTPTTAWDPVRLKRRIGYVIQEIGLFPHFTVARKCRPGAAPRRLGCVAHPAPVWTSCCDRWASSRSSLPRVIRAQLSGGQRQRVGVARALAADPSVLLFDEPFGALDPVTRLDLQKQFLALRRDLGKTAIFVTHDVREALMLATRIALLRDGALELVATPREFLDSPAAMRRAPSWPASIGKWIRNELRTWPSEIAAAHPRTPDAGADLHGDRHRRRPSPPAS